MSDRIRFRIRGYSLVETLVSLFILALAILGSTGLMLAALRENQRAAQQASAMHLAAEFAGMMRAYASRPVPDAAGLSFERLDFSARDPVPEQSDCYVNPCAPPAMAAFLLAEWRQRVARALPAGRVRICQDAQPVDPRSGLPTWECDEASGAPMVIKIGWPDRKAESPGRSGFNPGIVVFAGPAT